MRNREIGNRELRKWNVNGPQNQVSRNREVKCGELRQSHLSQKSRLESRITESCGIQGMRNGELKKRRA